MKRSLLALLVLAACQAPTSPADAPTLAANPSISSNGSTACTVTILQPVRVERGFAWFSGAMAGACGWTPQIHAYPQPNYKLCGWSVTTNGRTTRLAAVTPMKASDGVSAYAVWSPTSVRPIFDRVTTFMPGVC